MALAQQFGDLHLAPDHVGQGRHQRHSGQRIAAEREIDLRHADLTVLDEIWDAVKADESTAT